jgi:hypothetical protein
MNDATTFADVSIEAAIGKAEIMDNLKGMTCAQVYKIQMTNPYIHDPKTPTNFYKPRVIPEHAIMNKHKHVHADLMAAYAADAQTTATPWELWEACDTKSHYPDNGRWYTLKSDPSWNPSFAYRRKPKQHTVTLNTEQIKEILMACEYPSWENEDFKSGVLALEAALGVQPKTNAQIACDMLGQAHDALEEHSAEICEPNVDHIQRLVLDAMQLLAKGDVK